MGMINYAAKFLPKISE